jgi:hypothetical protein
VDVGIFSIILCITVLAKKIIFHSIIMSGSDIISDDDSFSDIEDDPIRAVCDGMPPMIHTMPRRNSEQNQRTIAAASSAAGGEKVSWAVDIEERRVDALFRTQNEILHRLAEMEQRLSSIDDTAEEAHQEDGVKDKDGRQCSCVIC